jgi:hypothetical protein
VILALTVWEWTALGVVGAAALAAGYVLWTLYRAAKAVIEDPDSADLFDGR